MFSASASTSAMELGPGTASNNSVTFQELPIQVVHLDDQSADVHVALQIISGKEFDPLMVSLSSQTIRLGRSARCITSFTYLDV